MVQINILKETYLIFEKFVVTDDLILINYMLLSGKFILCLLQFILDRCTSNNLSGFIARTGRVYNNELYTTRENNKLL